MDIKEMAGQEQDLQDSSSNNDRGKKFCQIEPDHPALKKIQEIQDLVHTLTVFKLKDGLNKNTDTAHVMEQLSFMTNFLDQYTRTAIKIALVPKMKYAER